MTLQSSPPTAADGYPLVVNPMTSQSHWGENGVRQALRLRSVATRLLVLRGHHSGGGYRLAENHAVDSVLRSGEASHEGDQPKDADSSTEQVESPAKG